MRIVSVKALIAMGCMGLVACQPTASSEPGRKKDDTIRIVLPDISPGLQQDKTIYRKQLEPTFQVVSQDAAADTVMANLFLEHVSHPSLVHKARHNILMINQEFADEPAKLAHVDLVLCKSRHAVEIMKAYRERNQQKFKLYYTKFTSLAKGKQVPKDYDLAVHFAGKSRFKNTQAVLRAWLGHPEFPRLVASCRNPDESTAGAFGCFGYHVRPLLPYLRGAQNLTVFTGEIPYDDFQKWQNEAGIYVVPSAVEGYGHYINEGRQRGAIVITTDAAPMNEMVKDGISGRLVDYNSSFVFNSHSKAPYVTIDPNVLAQVVKEVLMLSPEEKAKMGEAGRQQYLEDTKFFEERMALLVDSLVKTGDFSGISHLLE